MLNAIQQWFKANLDGLTSPLFPPLQAVVQPPVDVAAASPPIAYIWAADTDVERVSAPRPIGLQKGIWPVDVAVIAAMDIDDPNAEQAFPLLLDQMQAYMATYSPMPFFLTDPVTGYRTQIISLGEKWSLRYAKVRVPGGGQTLVKFGADFRWHVEENFSFQPGSYYRPNP